MLARGDIRQYHRRTNMGKHGKKFADAAAKVDPSKQYSSREALEMVKALAFAKFDETVEVHMKLSVDPRQADQQVRGVAALPAGTGKTVRILAFVEGETATAAREAGADFVGIDEFVQKVQDGWTEFDVALAVPQSMGKIGRLGRVLGPRGLMPSPKSGTMVQPADIANTIRQLRQGRVEFRVDKTANLHIPFGKVSFSAENLMANWTALMSVINRSRPASVKGRFIERITICSTMGPGFHIDVNEAMNIGG
jgi:large subunit ribosomal protein L1